MPLRVRGHSPGPTEQYGTKGLRQSGFGAIQARINGNIGFRGNTPGKSNCRGTVAGLRDLRPSREEREGWPVGPECPERLDEVVEEGELSLLAVRMDEPETRIEACRCEGAVAGRVEEPAEAVERRDRPEVCSATI